MTKSRWATPAFAVAAGVVMLGAFARSGEVGAGVSALMVMVVYAAILVAGRGRSETIAVLGGNATDERRHGIEREATIWTAHLLIAVILGAWLVEIARGQDGQPWSALGAVGGVGYLGSVLVLRRIR